MIQTNTKTILLPTDQPAPTSIFINNSSHIDGFFSNIDFTSKTFYYLTTYNYCFSIINISLTIKFMNDSTTKSNQGIKAFNTLYIVGVIFALTKLIDDLKWTYQLAKNWKIPEEPFFTKVFLVNAEASASVTAYLIFAIAYILLFGFIFLGLYQLNGSAKLFAEKKIFQSEVGAAFKKAGNSFLTFAFGTLLIDIAFLAWTQTSSRVMDLLSTELMVFLILGYVMYFLSDVFKEGIMLREENELTI